MFALTRRVTLTVFCFWQGISPARTVLPTEGLSRTDSPLPVRGSSTDPGTTFIFRAKALKFFIRETNFNSLCRYRVEGFPVICSVCLISRHSYRLRVLPCFHMPAASPAPFFQMLRMSCIYVCPDSTSDPYCILFLARNLSCTYCVTN